jgi:hypothetical protein
MSLWVIPGLAARLNKTDASAGLRPKGASAFERSVMASTDSRRR